MSSRSRHDGESGAVFIALLLASSLAAALNATQPEETLPSSDEEAVRAVIQDYKQALMDGEGGTAARLVDQGTLDYFQSIQELALSGSEEQVRARSFVDRLLVVTMRHELEREVLVTMDLEDLLRHAVDAGWIGKASIAQLGIGEVEVTGDEATGVALTRGQIPPTVDGEVALSYSFTREDGEWKFRFSSLVTSLNSIITQFAAQLGTNEDDLIFTLVQAISGRQVLPEIWTTPGEEPPPAEEPPSPK